MNLRRESRFCVNVHIPVSSYSASDGFHCRTHRSGLILGHTGPCASKPITATTCHTGFNSCFFRKIVRDADGRFRLERVEKTRVYDPKDVYGS